MRFAATEQTGLADRAPSGGRSIRSHFTATVLFKTSPMYAGKYLKLVHTLLLAGLGGCRTYRRANYHRIARHALPPHAEPRNPCFAW